MFAAVDRFNQKLQSERRVGVRRRAAGRSSRRPPSTTPVSARSSPTGRTLESKECLGGFWVIEAADLDAALAWATEGSKACGGRARSGRSRCGCVRQRVTPPSGIERIFREEYGRVVASLTRRFGDLDVAEEAAGEALLVALERWPVDGVPPNPGGWLTTTAGTGAPSTGSAASQQRDAKHRAALMIARRHPPRADRRRRRRPAPADLHLLPPGAGTRGPGGAHPAAARRPDRRRDRRGVPRPRDDHGPADHPGQGQDQGRRASPTACRRRTTSPSGSPRC